MGTSCGVVEAIELSERYSSILCEEVIEVLFLARKFTGDASEDLRGHVTWFLSPNLGPCVCGYHATSSPSPVLHDGGIDDEQY